LEPPLQNLKRRRCADQSPERRVFMDALRLEFEVLPLERLIAVPQFGLESVLVAVELVLERAAPNGSISAEHVRNVLARLSAPQTPEQAQTDLKLTLIPRADTARYDRLRPTHQDGLEVNHA